MWALLTLQPHSEFPVAVSIGQPNPRPAGLDNLAQRKAIMNGRITLLLAVLAFGLGPFVPNAQAAIELGASTTTPTVDGMYESFPLEYGDAAVGSFSSAGYPVQVYLKHTDTDLYVCLRGLVVPAPTVQDGPNAVVYIDRINGGGQSAHPDTLAFSISYSGHVRASRGSGSGYAGPDIPTSQYEIARHIYTEPTEWAAEFRISRAALGGGAWDRDIRIACAQQEVSAMGDDYGWPSGYAWTVPQSWEVARFTGDTTPGSVNFHAQGLEVAQTIQDLSHMVPLIAGKRTFVRFHVTATETRSGLTGRLFGMRGTTTLEPVLTPLNPGGAIVGLNFPSDLRLDDSLLFELPTGWTAAGPITLSGELNPAHNPAETDYTDNSVTTSVSFVPTNPLRIALRNITYSLASGTEVQARDLDLEMFESQLRRMYPVSQVDVLRRPLAFIGPSDFNRDIYNAAGFLNGLLAANRVIDGGVRRKQIGMVTDAGGSMFMRGLTPWGGAADAAWECSTPTGTNSCGWDFDGSFGDWYSLHELGHALGRPHVGRVFGGNIGCGAAWNGFLEAYPYDDGRIGGLDPFARGFLGFDAGDAGLRLPRRVYPGYWTDVMSYCPNEWISDFNYTRIRNYINGHFPLAARGAALAATPSSPPRLEGDYLFVYGTIDLARQTATLSLVSREPSVSEIPALVPGAYKLRLLDAVGATLASYALAPAVDSEEPSRGFILQVVPFAPGTRRIEVAANPATPGDVGAVAVSPNAPTVANVTHTGGFEVPAFGPTTISWTAADADGDPLHFTLKYSGDGGANWRVMVAGITSNSYTLDAGQVEGTHGALSGYFQVVANDGVNTGRAESDKFGVEGKPPVVRIANPAEGSVFGYGQVFALEASAYDFEDGTLDGTSIRWNSTINGFLGTGRVLTPSYLSPGTHVITVSATDADGQVASTGITVTILDDVAMTAPTSAVMDVTPSPLVFVAHAGSTPPTPLPLAIRSSGPQPLPWTATANAGWVQLSAVSGATPADLSVRVDPSGLPAGSELHGQITVSPSNPGADTPPTVDVILRVKEPYSVTVELPLTVRWSGKTVVGDTGNVVPALIGPPDGNATGLSGSSVMIDAFDLGQTYVEAPINPAKPNAGLAALLGVTPADLAKASVIAFEYNGGSAPCSQWESSRWQFSDGHGHELTVDISEALHPTDPCPEQPAEVLKAGSISADHYPDYASLFGFAPAGPNAVVSWVLFKLPPDIDTSSPEFTIKLTAGQDAGLPGEGTPDPDAVGVFQSGPSGAPCSSLQTVEFGTSWDFTPPVGISDSNINVQVLSTVTNAGPCGATFNATRTWLLTDSAGNSNRCTQTVSVVDTTPPVITCPNLKVFATSSEGASLLFGPTASDTGDPNPKVVCTPPMGTVLSFGTNRVDCTATDECGNQSAASFWVTVLPPSSACLILDCPTNILVPCQSTNGALVDYDPPGGNDLCTGEAIVWTCVPPPGWFMPGTTVVQCWGPPMADGETPYCQFTVTVAGQCPSPCLAFACPTNLVVPCEGPRGATVQFPVLATNLCSPADLAVSYEPPSGSVFPPGLSEVKCTVTGSGHTNQCRFTVLVAGNCDPRLEITLGTKNLPVITWPASLAGFSLQMTDVLGPATVQWQDVPPEMILKSEAFNQAFITDLTVAPRFFRLHSHEPRQDARFITQDTPREMIASEAYTVRITMRNTGETTWNRTDPDGFIHALGSYNPADNRTWIWSTDRITMQDEAVAPDHTTQFVIDLRAPVVPGTYHFQWRMIQEYGGWFGQPSDNVEVRVLPPSGFSPLRSGVRLTGPLAVAVNGNRRLEVFAQGEPNRLFDLRQRVADATDYSDWGELAPGTPGGVLAFGGSVSVALKDDLTLEAFGWGIDGRYFHLWQTENVPGLSWTQANCLACGDPRHGQMLGFPVVAVNEDGHLEVFGFDRNSGELQHTWPNPVLLYGGWWPWYSLGGERGGPPSSSPAVIRDRLGRLHVFIRWRDDSIRHIMQLAPNGDWTGWESLAGSETRSDPAVGIHHDGRLEVFVRRGDDHIWRKAQVPAGGWEPGWSLLGAAGTGGIGIQPVVASNFDGSLDVFVTGLDGSVQHISESAPDGTWPPLWQSLGGGGVIGNPAVGRNADNTLEVFVVGADHGLWHMKQIVPGTWH